MAKQIGHPPRRLSIVGSKADSAADKSAPAAQEDSATPELTGKERQRNGLLKAQQARRDQVAGVKARRAAGEKSRLEKFRAGEYPIEAWENAEVAEGKPRALDGTFSGAYPHFTGRQQQQIRAELLKRGQHKMDSLFGVAIETLASIARNGETESARVKAATILMERVAGKVPEKIEFKSSDPWQDILDEIIDDEVLNRMGHPEPHEAPTE